MSSEGISTKAMQDSIRGWRCIAAGDNRTVCVGSKTVSHSIPQGNMHAGGEEVLTGRNCVRSDLKATESTVSGWRWGPAALSAAVRQMR